MGFRPMPMLYQNQYRCEARPHIGSATHLAHDADSLACAKHLYHNVDDHESHLSAGHRQGNHDYIGTVTPGAMALQPVPYSGLVAVTRRVDTHGPPYHIRHPTLRRRTLRHPRSRKWAAC